MKISCRRKKLLQYEFTALATVRCRRKPIALRLKQNGRLLYLCSGSNRYVVYIRRAEPC